MHFQQKYANVVLELERLNKDLNDYLIGVQQFCSDVSSVRVWERCACWSSRDSTKT